MAAATNISFTYAGANPTTTTFVAATADPPANCVCIAILNPSDNTEDVYWGVVDPTGNPKIGDAAVVNTNCAPISPGSTFNVTIDAPGSVTVLYASSGALTSPVSIVYRNRVNGQL
jgi:hypothetical protein